MLFMTDRYDYKSFVIFIIDTNTNVSTIPNVCLNRYCIGDNAQLCIYIYKY